jgi:hypothetical protein
VKEPEQALAAARAAAGQGAEADGAPDRDSSAADSARRLAEWAIIEPEAGRVYSTRRYGRPITAGKRLLVRMLRQYIGQMSAQQSRFNAQVAAHVLRLEERVAELERAAGAGGSDTAGSDAVDGPEPPAAR